MELNINMETDKSTSEYISRFLTFLRQAQKYYKYYCDMQLEAENDICDILHELEFNETLTDEYYAALSKAIASARNKRRATKDKVFELMPVNEFMKSHTETVKMLERLLSGVRQEEKKHTGRFYVPRRNIVKEVLSRCDDGKCAPETTS